MRRWLLIVLCALLSACASLAPAPALFADAAFAPPPRPVQRDDILALSAEMRHYLQHDIGPQLHSKGRARALFDALQARGQLRLDYDASQTRNAAQTFAARSGNCLSLVLMTAALARELGLTVQYHSVIVDPVISRKGALQFASTHVNLTLLRFQGESLLSTRDPEASLTIDFLPPEELGRQQNVNIDEATVKAMYMNNRAAEALAQGLVDDAYWWARAAIGEQGQFSAAYNTLGVIYQRHGDWTRAAQVFEYALTREPDSTLLMQNLVPVLSHLGRTEQAHALQARLARLEPYPPFYYFDRGQAAMQRGDYRQARALFGAEVARAPYNHEFHFWLAQACYQLGQLDEAGRQLALALENSTSGHDHALYAAKLDWLRSHKLN